MHAAFVPTFVVSAVLTQNLQASDQGQQQLIHPPVYLGRQIFGKSVTFIASLKVIVSLLKQAKEYLRQSGHVNTYTFTKMLTELAIAEFNNTAFPVAIVRPSIVVRSLPWSPNRYVMLTTHATRLRSVLSGGRLLHALRS